MEGRASGCGGGGVSGVMTLKRYPSQGGMTFGKIGARRMMYKWRNPYVTDGLYLQWDAEWNAGGGSHDSQLRMIDLTGNGRDLTLPDTVIVHANNVKFTTGNGAYVNRPASLLQDFAKGWTVITTQSFRDVIFSGYKSFIGVGDYCCICGFRASDYLLEYNVNGSQDGIGITNVRTTYFFCTESQVRNPSQYILSVDIDNQVSTLYINGAAVSSMSAAGIVGNLYNRAGFGINTSAGYGRPGGGNANSIVFNALYYNRPLSADEAAAMYAVDKLRFNLP